MSSDLANGGSIDPATTTAAAAIKPRSVQHNRKNRNKAEGNNQPKPSRGDPLLREWTIVGDYPTPTDDSEPSLKRVPMVTATTVNTYAEAAAGREQIDAGN